MFVVEKVSVCCMGVRVDGGEYEKKRGREEH